MSNVHQQNTKFVSSGGPLVLVQNMLRRQWQSDCPIEILGVGFTYCSRSSVEQHSLDVVKIEKQKLCYCQSTKNGSPQNAKFTGG